MRFLARIIVSLLVLTSIAHGQNLRPPAHYRDFGACPFECCTYRRWSVVADTVLYKQRSETSGIAFRVNKGEHVTGLTGVVITLKPGKAIVQKPTVLGTPGAAKVRVKRGDVLYLLHYEGEGFYKFWLRGKIYEDGMPAPPDEVFSSTEERAKELRRAAVRKITEPKTVWWVKVRNAKGLIGWSKQDENFGDMDACG